ncbi:hypothetical protein QBC39DRAFT_333038 [Podospora conica]|nr:hypothetical protein QBC39DRAFT_333038 [Schizothecium conicum]
MTFVGTASVDVLRTSEGHTEAPEEKHLAGGDDVEPAPEYKEDNLDQDDAADGDGVITIDDADGIDENDGPKRLTDAAGPGGTTAAIVEATNRSLLSLPRTAAHRPSSRLASGVYADIPVAQDGEVALYVASTYAVQGFKVRMSQHKQKANPNYKGRGSDRRGKHAIWIMEQKANVSFKALKDFNTGVDGIIAGIRAGCPGLPDFQDLGLNRAWTLCQSLCSRSLQNLWTQPCFAGPDGCYLDTFYLSS